MTLRTTLSFSSLVLSFAGFLFLPLRGQDIPPELSAATAPAGSIWVDSLDLNNAAQGFGKTQAGLTVDNNKLTLSGVAYPHGVGTHAVGRLIIDLHGAATKFQSMVGLDDDRKGLGSIQFFVLVDGHVAAKTDILHGGDKPKLLTADLTGAHRLVLYVGDGGDGYVNDHADWAGALITLASGAAEKPESVAIVPRLKILPPDPHTAIHGAPIIGSTPGRFFLFSISATGTAPLTFAAESLPDGLTLDPKTGIITGSLKQAGSTDVKLTVSGPGGEAHRVLTIVGGDRKLALTPQMGWNSWNVWGNTVTEKKVKDAADEMIAAGLQAHGYQFVNVDQGWQPANDDPKRRDAQGNITSNALFPDMKGLSDYVHGKGLRIGLYSSPGPQTCGPYEGSYQHEDQDAQTYAAWGFDYLKYDWCSYGNIPHASDSVATLQLPYQKMRAALDKTSRDIFFSLCQYGMGDSWKWAADPSAGVMGNSWRTHGDIMDDWHENGAKEGVVLVNGGLWDIINNEIGHSPYAGPGHWNDPDMLQVGIVGFGDTHPSRLTPDEQITHISMWCMLAAPLLIGCDMTRLDEFTTAILSNDEALDIDQDPLGHEADLVSRDSDNREVWARPLSDGTWAVALLNGMDYDTKITADLSKIGIKGAQKVRDLWLHQDVGTFDGSYTTLVPSHCTVLLKIGTPAQKD
jgi:alpha-galactosidase